MIYIYIYISPKTGKSGHCPITIIATQIIIFWGSKFQCQLWKDVLGNRDHLSSPSVVPNAAEERRDFQRFLKNISPKISETLIPTLVGKPGGGEPERFMFTQI